MIDFINDLMNYKFLQHALIAGFVVSLTCSLLSSFVVLKKMAFIGQGISHTAFGGVALGLLLKDFLPNFNINISLITSIFTIGSSTLIWVFSR
ncbi:MAG: metal ABC transporter permease, partial [Spirochaetota bacterium]|nr:metal ABC transporter permease [Spirochaetota bacterium]